MRQTIHAGILSCVAGCAVICATGCTTCLYDGGLFIADSATGGVSLASGAGAGAK